MNIDFYERIWMWAAAVIIAVFIAVIGVSAVAYGLHPPSHIETIEPSTIFTDPRFSKLGEPIVMPDGTIEVRSWRFMFAFAPNEMRVPAGRPIRFRMTSVGCHAWVPDFGNQCQHDADARLHQPVHDRVHPGRRLSGRLSRVLRQRPPCHVRPDHRGGSEMTATVVKNPARHASKLRSPRTGQHRRRGRGVRRGVGDGHHAGAVASEPGPALPLGRSMYYMSVTAHGTLMALVFTTFFIMGFGYVVAQHSLGTALAMRRTAWVSFWIAVARHRRGRCRHPRGQSHGAVHLLPATQGASALLHRPDAPGRRIVGMGAGHAPGTPASGGARTPSRRIPLSVYGYAATIIVWLLATVGVAAEMLLLLIPWSLGWTADDRSGPGADVVLVVWPSARVFLAAARLCRLVRTSAASRGRQVVQRAAREARLRDVRPAVDARRLSPPVHGSRRIRVLEAVSHVQHAADPLSELRHGVHDRRVAGNRRADERRTRCSSAGSAACPGAIRS